MAALGQSDRHRRLRVRRIHRARHRPQLHALFERMGFRAVARHRSKDVTLYPPGRHQFHRQCRARQPRQPLRARARAVGLRHGVPRQGCGEGLQASDRARRQAVPESCRADGAEHPGHRGHRRQRDLSRRPLRRPHSIYDVDFVPTDPAQGLQHEGAGLTEIDHVTHNVFRGNMDKWAGFYETLFNFREIRYFDIEGKLTGLKSPRHDQPGRQDPHSRSTKAPTTSRRSRNICTPITAKASSTSRWRTDDIYASVETLRAARRRVPGHAGHLLRAARQPHQGPWRGRARG